MKLYYGLPSPYSRKVRVVAHELGLALDLEPTNAMAWDNGFGQVNPINRVPTLVLDDGRSLFDSRVICEYLDVQHGSRLLPASGEARWAVLRAQALGDGLMDAAVPRRHETLRPDEQQSPERLRLYRRSIDQTLDYLEADLRPLQGIDLGSIAIGCALSYLQFRFPDDGLPQSHPKIHAWLQDFSQRESMTGTPFA